MQRLLRVALAAVTAVAGVALILVLFTDVLVESIPGPGVEVSNSSDRSDDFQFTLSFGLSRLPITRSVLLALCPDPRYAECKEPAVQGAAFTRPEVTSAGLEADLQEIGGDAEFPANQLTVAATNEGAKGLRITVTAEPRQPERVDAGTYRGTLVVDRSDREQVRFDMITTLAARKGGISVKAVLFLALGAVFGGAVKWLNDVYAPLSGLRRRQHRLARLMRPDLPYLPVAVSRSLDDLRESIRVLDREGVAERLDLIVQRREELTEFSAAVKALQREIDIQAALIARTSDQRLKTFLDRQQHKLDALRSRSWPWQDADQVLRDCSDLQTAFEEATDRLQGVKLASEPERMKLVDELGTPTDMEQEQALFQAEEEAEERMKTRERERDVARNGFEWLLDHAWWILLLVSVLVVTAFGYQTQYVENDAYEGDARDIAKLVAWAFALQLAGTTVVEAVGRLSPRSTSD